MSYLHGKPVYEWGDNTVKAKKCKDVANSIQILMRVDKVKKELESASVVDSIKLARVNDIIQNNKSIIADGVEYAHITEKDIPYIFEKVAETFARESTKKTTVNDIELNKAKQSISSEFTRIVQTYVTLKKPILVGEKTKSAKKR